MGDKLFAGKLRRRLTLQRASISRDATGQVIEDWVNLAWERTVWAHKQDVSDGERLAASEISATITTRFQIRYTPAVADLKPTDRAVYRGKVYDVAAVKEIGLKVGLEISGAARADA